MKDKKKGTSSTPGAASQPLASPLAPPVPDGVAPAGRIASGVLILAALAGALMGVVQIAWHLRLFAGRAGFPLDLEWMEGGLLMHAQRLVQGQPLYAPPSFEFIPYLYTPLYPAVVALASRLLPMGYLLGRCISVCSFFAALTLLALGAMRQARRTESEIWRAIDAFTSPAALATQGQPGAPLSARWRKFAAFLLGLSGAGVVAAGFGFSGAFFDLVRADSLLLFLEAAALYAAMHAAATSGGRANAVLAGVLIALAFFTKQTASIIGVGIGVGLLIANWRRALAYGVAAAAVLSGGILWMTASTHGWFWTYVFKLHQSHSFDRKVAFADTPLRIWQHQKWALLALFVATAGLAFHRHLRRSDAVVWCAAIAGFLAACAGFGTQWAFDNAYIPAVFFPALAAAALGSRLVSYALAERKFTAVVLACLTPALLGAQSLTAGPPNTARFMPRPSDHAAAQRFLTTLRAQPGDGFIPFHPYYSVLVGKRPFVHRMGVKDVGGLLGRPSGLDAMIAEQHFPFIVLDWKSQPGEWPALEDAYHVVSEFHEGVDTVRAFSGADTWPSALLLPTRKTAALPPGGVRVGDFETGQWEGWSATGDAFGATPGPATGGLSGKFAADSARYGAAPQGTLRSPPITIATAHLRFILSGPRDPGLRVLLLDGSQTVQEGSPTGSLAEINWNVGALAGHTVVLVVQDKSATGGVAIDDVVAY